MEMDHSIGPPEGSCRQAPDVGGVPDGGRGAEDGGELGEQVRAGDDACFVALSRLHLPCSSISKPRSNLDHVHGQKILWRKCCKPSVELREGLLGARVRLRLSWMLTLHHLRTVNPAVEPLRAGTAFGSER